jgi:hypothetical protein
MPRLAGKRNHPCTAWPRFYAFKNDAFEKVLAPRRIAEKHVQQCHTLVAHLTCVERIKNHPKQTKVALLINLFFIGTMQGCGDLSCTYEPLVIAWIRSHVQFGKVLACESLSEQRHRIIMNGMG